MAAYAPTFPKESIITKVMDKTRSLIKAFIFVLLFVYLFLCAFSINLFYCLRLACQATKKQTQSKLISKIPESDFRPISNSALATFIMPDTDTSSVPPQAKEMFRSGANLNDACPVRDFV